MLTAIIAACTVGVCLYQRCKIVALRRESRRCQTHLARVVHSLWFVNSGLLAYIDQTPAVKKSRAMITDILTKSSCGK